MASTPATTSGVAHNDLAPISCLHTEILQDIFDITQQLSSRHGKTTLKLSWVCHRWRDLVHQTSSLWCCIDFTNVEWVQTSLSRASGRELEFRLWNLGYGMHPDSIKTPSPLVQLCLGNLSRVKVLEMHTEIDYMAPALFPSSAPEWLTPAPLLADLEFDNMWLPPHVFSGVYPSLQSLTLVKCSFDWDTVPIIRGLTALTITEPRPSADIDKIIKIFRIISPTVEVIKFTGLFEHDFTFNPVDKIHFEQLDMLVLDEFDPNTIMNLLTTISVAKETTIELQIDERDDSSDGMIQALLACRNIEKWPISFVEILGERSYPTVIVKEGWPSTEGTGADELPYEDDESVNNYNTRHVQLSLGDYTPSEVITVLNQLPIHPIHEVRFNSIGMGETPDDYFRYVSTLDTVRILKIQLPDLKTFCAYIDSKATQVWDQLDDAFSDTEKIANSHTVLGFLNLQELHIYCVHKFDYQNFVWLRNWVLCRMMVSLPLGRLHISKMEVPSIQWVRSSFSQLVGRLEIDNVVENLKDVLVVPVYFTPRNSMVAGYHPVAWR